MFRLQNEVGFGNMTYKDWECLVKFRMNLSASTAKMLLDCLFQVNQGLTTRGVTG